MPACQVLRCVLPKGEGWRGTGGCMRAWVACRGEVRWLELGGRRSVACAGIPCGTVAHVRYTGYKGYCPKTHRGRSSRYAVRELRPALATGGNDLPKLWGAGAGAGALSGGHGGCDGGG